MSIIKKADVKLSGMKWKFNIELFDSADEVVRTCRARQITDSRFNDMKNHDIHEDWHGVSSYEEALMFMRDGYEPSVEDLTQAFKSQTGTQKRFQFVNDVQGFAPVVPLALMGVPNAYASMRMKPIKTKVIDIYYDMTATARYEPEDFIEAGKAFLSAVVALERQGYRFNLYATQAYCEKGNADMLVVKVKSSTQPLDLKRVSFPLTHPAFFRVIGFDWYSKVPGGQYRSGYGNTLTLFADDSTEIGNVLFGGKNKAAKYFSCSQIIGKKEEYIKEVLIDDGNR